MLDRVLGGTPSPLRPVRVTSAVDEVSDRLLTAIAVGDFLPGERLPPERELTGLLRVSRPTVREAVARLQALGVIEIRRGRSGGAFVRDSWTTSSAAAVRRTLLPRWEEFEQLFDLRGLVEGMVAATAARRRRPEDLEAMRAALSAHLSATTPREEQAADSAFHQSICAATRNPQIALLSRDLLTRISLGFPVEPWGRGERTHFHRAGSDHTSLYEAVAAGEPERAEEIARRHFMISAEMIRDVLARVRAADGS
ncbi:FadR/GntR family transcriptional regulator [Streptomyces cylindrosporus]|uniref:FCD domain-containing protein n=1 Tax=Streptomyces cylindrosporus TaxID=2927583 RepID=A0ABS9YDR8_9ACTN|nr:FCD domain-containing protein [Streptomyces cylindrosporus]MCI3275373.1 FCD domain-containing protein [Streptomyces cylindrosporus]